MASTKQVLLNIDAGEYDDEPAELYAIAQGESDGVSSAVGLEPLSWATPGTAVRRRLGSPST